MVEHVTYNDAVDGSIPSSRTVSNLGQLAQLVEHLVYTERVTGSSPVLPTMNKIIVTGGAGFIGSRIVRRLLTEYPSAEIVVIDNLSTGKEENLREIKDKITFAKIDVRDFDSIKDYFKGADLVFHEAALPSVPRSIKEPALSHTTNIDGTFNVFLAAKEGGVKRVVYAASSSAYGNTAELPKKELFQPKPLSPYAVQKLVGEYYGQAFKNVFGMEVISLRYFNVFGPRQDPSSAYAGVIPIFAKAIINKTSPTIFGDGNHTRDFTFVDNVVDLNILAAKAETPHHSVYNGGTGNRYSLKHVWETLNTISGLNIDPIYTGVAREGDVLDSQADISLATADFGYAPKIGLKEGLEITLEWYRKNLK